MPPHVLEGYLDKSQGLHTHTLPTKTKTKTKKESGRERRDERGVSS